MKFDFELLFFNDSMSSRKSQKVIKKGFIKKINNKSKESFDFCFFYFF